MNLPTIPRKVLSVFSLVMINVIAVDNLRSLPFSAVYGFSIVFFYILGAIAFMIPITLVAAELATGWPKTGGLYVWVREAFGARFGFVAIWLYWIYNVVWYPTILAFLATTIAYMSDPHLVDNKLYMFVAVMVLFWLSTLINVYGMKASSFSSTIGALVGTIIPMLFISGLGIYWWLEGKPLQIAFTWHSFWPDLSNVNNLVFLVAILFGLIGMEMSASHAEEVKNPNRDYPRALFYSTVIILTTLILASLAIAMVIPQKQLNIVAGLSQAFDMFFSAYNLKWLMPIISLLIVVGGLSGVVAWIIGPTKGLMIAAADGCVPKMFCKTNAQGVPVNLLILQGIIVTILSSMFLWLPSVSSSYWILSAMTAQLALLVYIFMFAAVIYLRYKEPDVHRTFRIPGGKLGVWIVAGLGLMTSIATIGLGFIPPTGVQIGSLAKFETILITGCVVFTVIPFLFRRRRF